MIKKFKFKTILMITILIVIMSLTSIVNAFSINMKLDSASQLEAGKTIEVVLKISNIDAGNGIDAISGTIEYDKNVFDEVTQNSFEGINNWNIGLYDTQTQTFTLLRSSKVNTASDLLKITLKVKENVNTNSTTIKIKGITASGGAVVDGGTGDIEVTDTNIEIKKATTTNPIVNEIKTNTITNEIKVNTIANKVTNQTNNPGGKLPQTGENTATIIVGISIVAVVAIIAFVKYRNLDIK